ncbi:hypothetical protein FRC15_007897 [Serendipita sp. 397]|nr:hypothetical protein FRC15_007897 [Serendipita sp. 397]
MSTQTSLTAPKGARLLHIYNIPPQAEAHVVKLAIAKAYNAAVLEYRRQRNAEQPLISVEVILHEQKDSSGRLQRKGSLLVPDYGYIFQKYVETHPVQVVFYPDWNDRTQTAAETLSFSWDRSHRVNPYKANNLLAMPWHSPALEKEHKERLDKLRHQCSVSEISFGFDHFYWNERQRKVVHRFCVEWCYKFGSTHSQAHLEFHDSINTIEIMYGNAQEYERSFIKLRYENIKFITVKNLTLIFTLYTPPILEQGPINHDQDRQRRRLPGLDPQHERVMTFCPRKLRVTLYGQDILNQFQSMAKGVVGLPFLSPNPIIDTDDGLSNIFQVGRRKTMIKPADYLEWTGDMKMLEFNQKKLSKFPFHLAFQIAALLHNGLLNPIDVRTFCDIIDERIKSSDHSTNEIADLVAHFAEHIPTWTLDTLKKTTLEKRFQMFEEKFWGTRGNFANTLRPGWFWGYRVTITPTIMKLEGRSHEQSNGVIRRYSYASDRFLRVNFTDEERLQMRWDRDVNGEIFVEERIGGFLKRGLDIAGRHYEFLGYSSSGLREHSMWFVHPFYDHDKNLQNAETIRRYILDVKLQTSDDSKAEFKLVRQPAKFGARLAQAFSTTEPAIELQADEIERRNDIKVQTPTNSDSEFPVTATAFTDGYGCMSLQVAEEIWRALNPGTEPLPEPAPAVYQVRIGGAKGVLGIDPLLPGRRIVLHKSMVKFESTDYGLHIANRFDHPLSLFLNRPLIAILEHQGISIEWFIRLLTDAQVQMDRTLLAINTKAADFLAGRHLGRAFGFPQLINNLFKCQITRVKLEEYPHPIYDFFLRCLDVAKAHVDRELKYKARIPVPSGLSLVGVADVHLELEEGEVYICTHRTEERPKYFPDKAGYVYITRSPSIQPGDVQKFKAMHPPPGSLYASHPIVNAVVFSCKGKRPPASMLGGGDLDGDLFQIIPESDDFKMEIDEPGDYPTVKPKELDKPCTIEDIGNFVVNYINSDKMGLVSIQHLIIADQSQSGLQDPKCMKLAELHSKAVDFAKSGVPVSFSELPKRYFPFNPDFQHKETQLDDQTNYYESNKALGVLYRKIKVDELPQRDEDSQSAQFPVKEHPIWQELMELCKSHVTLEAIEQERNLVLKTFYEYSRKLSSIKQIYTIGRKPLTEAEVYMGTILQSSSQTKRRDEMCAKLGDATAYLVEQVKWEFQGYSNDPVSLWLVRSFCGWHYSLETSTHQDDTGKDVKEWKEAICSFGLLSLRSAFEALDVIGKRRPDPRRKRSSD